MSKIQIDAPEHIHFSTRCEVRIQDVNYRKHLGHDHLISMIHNVRASFFESLGISELEDSSEGYILADLAIMYLDEGFFGDELIFELSLTSVSERSCQMTYQVRKLAGPMNLPKLVARAKTGVVFYDYESRKAIALPEPLKRCYENKEAGLIQSKKVIDKNDYVV